MTWLGHLQDYFIYSQLAAPTGGTIPVATRGDEMTDGTVPITEDTARDWASAIGAVTVGEMDILETDGQIRGKVSWPVLISD